MAKKMTAASVKKVKPDPTRRLEIPDAIVPGLYLIVQPTGRKSWAVRFRRHGKPAKHTLAGYPALKLDKAREKARVALGLVDEGGDPREDKRRAKEAPSDLVEDVVEDFIERYVTRNNRPRSAIETKRALRQRIKAAWKGRSIHDITRRDIIDLLEDIAADAPATAIRTRATVSKLFAWCMDRGILDATPAARLPAPAPVVERERVLSDAELKILWSAFETRGEPFGLYMQILLLTGQRRGEVATMQWDYIDLDAALWTIPRELVKADRTHEVPLSLLAVEILNTIKRSGPYVFTSHGRRPISGFSKAKKLIDTEARKIVVRLAEGHDGEDPRHVNDWRLHDLRRTCGTGMARLGIADTTISRVLNHAEGGVTRIYRRYGYLDEKRHALEAWAAHVKAIVDGQDAENVVTLRSGA